MIPYPTALTIAGSDSGGGAGVQADLKTFLDHRVFGMSAIAAITAQNSRGVRRIDPVPPEGLLAQLEAIFDDFPVGAVKIGMLGTATHARTVARFLASLRRRPPVILDPVMVSSTGHRLLDAEAEAVLREELMPLASLATPNLAEAAALAQSSDRAAALAFAASSPCPVLVTGGDVEGEEIIDILVEGPRERRWRGPRLGQGSFHGTGCTLSSAIAARIASGEPLHTAIDNAISYVRALIAATVARGSIGAGHPSLPHGLIHLSTRQETP